MKYTIRAEISFDTLAEADSVYRLMDKVKDKIYKPIGTEPIGINAMCQLWEDHHDDVPPLQCTLLKQIDFS